MIHANAADSGSAARTAGAQNTAFAAFGGKSASKTMFDARLLAF